MILVVIQQRLIQDYPHTTERNHIALLFQRNRVTRWQSTARQQLDPTEVLDMLRTEARILGAVVWPPILQ